MMTDPRPDHAYHRTAARHDGVLRVLADLDACPPPDEEQMRAVVIGLVLGTEMESEMDRIRLFSNGEEYRTWEHNNCDRCVKAWPGNGPALCDLEEALAFACFDDGTIAPEIAARLGYAGDPQFWCKEYQAEGKPEPKSAARLMAQAGAPMLPGLEMADGD